MLFYEFIIQQNNSTLIIDFEQRYCTKRAARFKTACLTEILKLHVQQKKISISKESERTIRWRWECTGRKSQLTKTNFLKIHSQHSRMGKHICFVCMTKCTYRTKQISAELQNNSQAQKTRMEQYNAKKKQQQFKQHNDKNVEQSELVLSWMPIMKTVKRNRRIKRNNWRNKFNFDFSMLPTKLLSQPVGTTLHVM